MSALIDPRALVASLADFAKSRDWDRFHTPRKFILALVGEMGELAELFQWRTDAEARNII